MCAQAPKEVRRAVKRLIPLWKTDVVVNTAEGPRTIPINLKRVVFQGDSMSPLLFCLSVAPISHELRKGVGSGVTSSKTQ